ncbi:sugar porter family MFS transporter [uncultured Erythrobacter sp.]|uniref:sugar porter family MFS transporter n=1 Tax=uncultured Erythrobacter sp. TaxID=263913 RepID=UPI00260726FC|nr:sugar porter family MFS transporter [uncultured Erythrobacter sp.]
MGGERTENIRFIGIIVSVATLGGFLFGFDSGVINGTVDGLQEAFDSTSVGTGFNVASMLLGCAVGAFIAGRLSDMIGRRSVLLIAAVLFIISAWGSGVAGDATVFVIARILGGLAVGAASVIAPAYISEVAPADRRGRLSSIQQVMIIVGLTAAFLSNYLLAEMAGGSRAQIWGGFEAWRWMFWAELVPATLFLVLLFFIPESPRYLVAKRREKEAQSVLAKLLGESQVPAKLQEIRESLAGDHQPRLSDLVSTQTGRIRTIVWVGIGLATFQQLVGINIVFYYGAVLWQAVGFTENDALKINVLSGALSIGAVFAAIALIDRIGRKPLLLIGSVGMAIGLTVMAFAFASGSLVDGELVLSDGAGIAALIAANAYVVAFNFSWGPVMWVMLGEMFPNQIRGSGLAVSGFAQWTANFLIIMSFPWLLTNIGLPVTYGFYAAAAVISVFFVAKMVRETAGRELEAMEG